jgi:hypothetical protein
MKSVLAYSAVTMDYSSRHRPASQKPVNNDIEDHGADATAVGGETMADTGCRGVCRRLDEVETE